jgi:hypothetical protein
MDFRKSLNVEQEIRGSEGNFPKPKEKLYGRHK